MLILSDPSLTTETSWRATAYEARAVTVRQRTDIASEVVEVEPSKSMGSSNYIEFGVLVELGGMLMNIQSRADDMMTQLVEVAISEASANSTYHAARIMHTHGVPIHVARRVLLRPNHRRNYQLQ
jgi:hypothetical protein